MWNKFWLNKWFGFMVIFLLAVVTSLFQINSYWADKHSFNGAWTVIGILLILAGIYFGWKANKTSSGKGG